MSDSSAILELLQWASIALYFAVAGGALYWANRKPSSVRAKAISVVAALALLGILPGSYALRAIDQQRSRAEVEKYREAAWAHFKQRCRDNAGEAIEHVAANVTAIFLANPRRRATESDLRDQFWMGDPYGYSNYEGLYPIGTYLYDRSGNTVTGITFTPIKGYKFVETPNPAYRKGSSTGPYLRYELKKVRARNSATNKLEDRVEPRSIEVDALLSRYGVTWEDISTREDRNFWVAGGKLTVFDLRTNATMGKRIGYVIDPSFGSAARGRRPWLAVGRIRKAFCPPFENSSDRNKEFVAKVLKAADGERRGQ